MVGALSEAVQLGGGAYRGNLYVLSLAAGAPQAPEVDEHARTDQRGTQAPLSRSAHLPESRELPAPDAGPGGRDPRGLDRAASVPEHGVVA